MNVGTVIGKLGCSSVLENLGKNPDVYAPPSGAWTAARWPVRAVNVWAVLCGFRVFGYLIGKLYLYDLEI